MTIPIVQNQMYSLSVTVDDKTKKELIAESLDFLCKSELQEVYEFCWSTKFNAICKWTYLSHEKLYGINVRVPNSGGHTTSEYRPNMNNSPEHEVRRAYDYVSTVYGSVEAFEVWLAFNSEFSNSKLNGKTIDASRRSPSHVFQFCHYLQTGHLWADLAEANKLESDNGLIYNSDRYNFEFEGLKVQAFVNRNLKISGLSTEAIERYNAFVASCAIRI